MYECISSIAAAVGMWTVPAALGTEWNPVKAFRTPPYIFRPASFSLSVTSWRILEAQSNGCPGAVRPSSIHFFMSLVLIVAFERSTKPCVCGCRGFPCVKLEVLSSRKTSFTHWFTNSLPLSLCSCSGTTFSLNTSRM